MRDPHDGIYNAKQPPLKKNPPKVKTNKQTKNGPSWRGEDDSLGLSAGWGGSEKGGRGCNRALLLAPASRLGWAWPVQEVVSVQEC